MPHASPCSVASVTWALRTPSVVATYTDVLTSRRTLDGSDVGSAMSPSMYSLKKVTASTAEGKESSGEFSSCSFGHLNVSPDECGALDEVDVCATDSAGAVAGSHATRVAMTGSETMSLLRTNGRAPLDFRILPSRSLGEELVSDATLGAHHTLDASGCLLLVARYRAASAWVAATR